MEIRLLVMQLQIVLAVIAVLLVRGTVMKKLPKVYSYVLWILIFAKLLCPVTYETDFGIIPSREKSVEWVQQVLYEQRDTVSDAVGGQRDSVDEPENKYEEDRIGSVVNAPDSKGVQTEDAYGKVREEELISGSIDRMINIGFLMMSVIWVLGTAVVLGYNAFAMMRVQRYTRKAELVKENVYLCRGIVSPFTLGLLHPRIYLPKDLSEEEWDYIICHERVHIRRKDYLVKNAAYLLTALYWFNPFVWIAFLFLERDMEMSCDERVILLMGEDIKRGYSQSLLNFARGGAEGAITPLTFGENSVKQRVKNVLSYKNAKRWSAIAGMIILIMSGVILFTAYGYKAQEDYGNGYIPEMDYPFMYEAGIEGTYIAESETGYYYISGHFLFYADKSAMEPVPLCNKPNCKHMDETDDTEVYYCNAYLGRGITLLPYIQYYQNEIYTIEGFNAAKRRPETNLIKISADGSQRERLMEVSDNCLFAIHRGYFYIAKNGYNANIIRVPMDKLDSDPEVVFESRLDSSSFHLSLKGNYLLIRNQGTLDEDNIFRVQLFTHNIMTGETVQILEDEEDSAIYPSLYNSNDERLIYSKTAPYEYGTPISEENIIYASGLDGTNEIVFQDFRDKTDKFSVQLTFDGNYYYEEWQNAMLEEEEQKGHRFNVYDKDFNLLYSGNSDWLPGHFWIAYGSGPHLFVSYKDKETGEYVIDYAEKDLFEQGRFEPQRLSDSAPTPPIGWRVR